MSLAIMGAMPEEVDALVGALSGATTRERGQRTYHSGELWGVPATVVFSRWGKTAAATTATHLLTEFRASRLLFTGVAGAVDPALRVGDVVVATRLVQHDMDARPLYPRHEIPLLGRTYFDADAALRQEVAEAAGRFLAHDLPAALPPPAAREFGIAGPRVLEGVVASGDRFFASHADVEELRGRLPGVACVEMEGAAVAQVCHEYGVPFALVRTISDAADESAEFSFPAFVRAVARTYSLGIVRRLVGQPG